MQELYHNFYLSPVGLIRIDASKKGIKAVTFIETQEKQPKDNIHTTKCIKQLDEYFKGERKTFSVLFDIEGTEFQKNVWNELLQIQFGSTSNYLEIAQRINRPKAIRAVGSANGKNKIAIIIPCHRVIGKNGKLVGYNAEIWRKQWLLEHEKTL